MTLRIIKANKRLKALNSLLTAALFLACFASGNNTVHAQNTVDIMPAKTINNGQTINNDAHTHPPIRLTPDKSEIINLDREATSIIIGNPNHLGILADSSKRIILVPRAPGASYFTILDKTGEVIMQRHAIVASPKKQYVRIRRSCTGATDNKCQPTKVFYCPDMCHEIKIDTGEEASTGGTAGKESTNQSADADTAPEETSDNDIQ